MKRILLLLASAAMMLGTACGTSGQSAPSADDPAGTTTEYTAETTGTEPPLAVIEPVTETTLTSASAEQTETTPAAPGTETDAQTGTSDTAASTSLTIHTAGIARKPLPDTAAIEKEIKQYKRGCAVLLESLDGTPLYSYHPDTLIPGASLIKLPYVYYCCTQIDAGKFKLTDTMTHTDNFTQGGSGIMRNQKAGGKYTLKELMEYSLKYSDNTAYYMLVTKFGADGFNKMAANWGHSRITITTAHRFPAVTASFICSAMKKMYAKRADGECWANAWDALVHSEHGYCRDIIGGTQDIAMKYGSIEKQYHEGFLVDGDKPYVMVLLSGAVNYKADEQFVKNIISDAKEIAEEYNSDY